MVIIIIIIVVAGVVARRCGVGVGVGVASVDPVGMAVWKVFKVVSCRVYTLGTYPGTTKANRGCTRLPHCITVLNTPLKAFLYAVSVLVLMSVKTVRKGVLYKVGVRKAVQ